MDGREYKLIPTDVGTNLVKVFESNTVHLLTGKEDPGDMILNLGVCHHLHQVEESEIYEGEYYVVDNIRVRQVRRATEHDAGKTKLRVVKTTDTSLETCQCGKTGFHKMGCKDGMKALPQFTREEILKYISEEYNK